MELHKPVQMEREPREGQAPQQLWKLRAECPVASVDIQKTEVEASWRRSGVWRAGVGVARRGGCGAGAGVLWTGRAWRPVPHIKPLTMINNAAELSPLRLKEKGFWHSKLHQLAGKFLCVGHSIKMLSSKGTVPLLAIFFTLINYCFHTVPVGRCFPKPISEV